ncbi:radical SAM protein [Kitasatospora acidiphila]|uniref:radical SAM protein n=1 Tax=Kitasatospora acidiphila TaxID=2567942 RepID=UPI003C789B9E
MHQLITSRFLDDYLVVCPGSIAGIKIPVRQFAELEQAAKSGAPAPSWLIKAARQRWAMDLAPASPVRNYLLLRESAEPQYSRASWEINLGCNYDCEHCYLGLKKFEGLSMADKARLLHVMRDAGVLWLQITGGEPTIDRDFTDSYALAYELGMMITISTNGSRLWQPKILDALTRMPAYRVVVSVYGATAASYDGLTRRRGSFAAFQKGMAAALEAGIPMRLNLVVTEHSADEEAAMWRWPSAGGWSTTATSTCPRRSTAGTSHCPRSPPSTCGSGRCSPAAMPVTPSSTPTRTARRRSARSAATRTWT